MSIINKKEGIENRLVCSCITWNLVSLVMEAKASQMTSLNAILSPSWEQWRRWVPSRSKGCPQMQWINPRAIGWGMVNLVHNTRETTSKAKWKDRVIGWTKSHAFTLGAHWFVCAPIWFNLHYLAFFLICAYWLFFEL
jgi:hypothetical protein